ncbi:hypothetical protein PYCC9005_000679 [Savitreella phatthalungensis]
MGKRKSRWDDDDDQILDESVTSRSVLHEQRALDTRTHNQSGTTHQPPLPDEPLPDELPDPPLPDEPLPEDQGPERLHSDRPEQLAPDPPPLPDEQVPETADTPPPLPDEPVPETPEESSAVTKQNIPAGDHETSEDAWEAILDAASGEYYFHNRSTGKTTWENPRLASISTTDTVVPTVTAYFDKHGKFVPSHRRPELHTSDARADRQLSAFFDPSTAPLTSDGRSLRRDRQKIRWSKEQVKAFKQKKQLRKEDKRRGWLSEASDGKRKPL